MKRLLLCMIFIFTLLLVVYRPVYPTKHPGPAAAATIRKGTTTKQQVHALLGTPQDIERQVPIRQPARIEPLPARYLASEIWTYRTYSHHGTANAAPSAKPSCYFIVVFFDAQGKVLDCETELDD
ncbi:hypothetical protein [Geobacter sp. AOG2]|uniref:hypothetical protein n=1 Tax=Geobacter sp. AOG2 TaxID=1566347 RepID=UPI001CC6A691|nr:hypothetical protein [Geobacter sp. AOG2]